MKRFQMARFSYLLVMVLAAFPLTGGTVKAMPLLSCGSWSVVSSPNAGLDDILYGQAAVPGTQEFWAVGRYDGSNGFYQTLTELWNGSSWSVVSSPNVAHTYNILHAVAADSATEAWAVGLSDTNGYSPGSTLIEHWNGTSWSIVSSPSPRQLSLLNGVAADSTNDVWAVGQYELGNGSYDTLIEHWNGTSWSVTASPSSGTYDELQGVAALAANNVWAVGSYYNTISKQQQTLVEHWNGTSWSIVSSPNVGSGEFHDNYLLGVAAVPGNPSDIWAVGKYYSPAHGYQTLVEQWNGTRWSVVKSPSPGGAGGNPILYSVTADSASDAWAVGYMIAPSSAYLTLVVHWDGTSWSVVSSPSPGGTDVGDQSVLYGVAAISATNVSAVGYYQTGVFIPTSTLAEADC